MTRSAFTVCVLALAIIGAGCGGDDASEFVQRDPDVVDSGATAPDDDASADEDSSDGGTTAGFGELIEGSFVLSGAIEEQFDVSDSDFAFQTGGGCQDGAWGFSVHVTDAAATTTFAMFNAQGQDDLSGGVTGEFDNVDFDATIFADGDLSLAESIEGPVTMTISEHDTGGPDADFEARRLTVSLVGSVPSDTGVVDVDVNYRWVMGCP